MTAAANGPWSIRNAWASYIPGHWVSDALCAQVEPAIFFPEKGESAAAAKSICRSCPVVEACAEYAINSPIPLHGVWGSLTAVERREIRRFQKIQDQPEEEHGTEASRKRHERRGEPACAACREAARQARRRREENRK